MKNTALLSLTSALLLSSSLVAKAEFKREHGSHVHGAGHLNIALEDSKLDLQIMVPAFDIIGFGHKATTAADKKTLADAKAFLNDSKKMFTLSPDAKCTIKKINIEQKWKEKHEEGHHEEKHADKHKAEEKHHDEKHEEKHADKHKAEEKHHDKKHEEKHADKHKAEEKHHDEKHEEKHPKAAHSSFTLHYSYQCAAPEQLKEASTGYFSFFSRAETLKTSILSNKGQKGLVLTPKASKIKF